MSSQVQFVVELDVIDLAKFEGIAAACIEKVQASEPATLAYTWNLSDDGTKCVILEWYESAEVIPAHLALVGPMLADMESCARVTRFQVLGDVDGEVRASLEAMGVAICGLWAGFSRCGKSCC